MIKHIKLYICGCCLLVLRRETIDGKVGRFNITFCGLFVVIFCGGPAFWRPSAGRRNLVCSRRPNTQWKYQQDAACSTIYYSKVYWKLNMFWAAHRSSSGALNCICSLWFICLCGDRPLSGPDSSDGRSPHGYINQRLHIQFRAPDVWAVCRSKHVELSVNFWNNKFYYKLHLVGIFTESYYDARIHEYQI